MQQGAPGWLRAAGLQQSVHVPFQAAWSLFKRCLHHQPAFYMCKVSFIKKIGGGHGKRMLYEHPNKNETKLPSPLCHLPWLCMA